MTSRSRLRGEFAVTKTLASIEPGPDDESGPGTFSLILSTDDVDRDGEVVDKGAFNPLPDHIAMDIDHGMSVATTVASGRPFYNADGNLQVDGSFASTELGQNVRTLVREGHIRTASVAMIPLKKTTDEDGRTHITKGDLLNGAFTPVPSNRSAMLLSAKSATRVLDEAEALLKAGRRNATADQAILQTIHDLVSNLGAICGNGSSEEGGSSGDPDNDGDANGVERSGRSAVEHADTKTAQVTDTAEDENVTAAAATKAAAAATDDSDVWAFAATALNAVRDL
jgi:hypothetical protein